MAFGDHIKQHNDLIKSQIRSTYGESTTLNEDNLEKGGPGSGRHTRATDLFGNLQSHQDLIKSQRAEMYGAAGDVLKKSMGEGSRGGHIIGHTKSGKPVYEPKAVNGKILHSNKSSTKANYSHFTPEDHDDAYKILDDHHEKAKDIYRENFSSKIGRKLSKPDKTNRLEGYGVPNSSFKTGELNQKEISSLKDSGLESTIQGTDYQKYYHKAEAAKKRKLINKVSEFHNK